MSTNVNTSKKNTTYNDTFDKADEQHKGWDDQPCKGLHCFLNTTKQNERIEIIYTFENIGGKPNCKHQRYVTNVITCLSNTV